MIIFSIILFTFVILAEERIQKKVGLGPEEIEILKSDQNKFKIEKSPYPRIHLIRARGDLNVTVLSSSETYEAYFHTHRSGQLGLRLFKLLGLELGSG